MGIIGNDQRQPCLRSQTQNALIHLVLQRNPVVLQFQIEVVWSKHLGKTLCRLFCSLIVILRQRTGNLACQAGRKCNQALSVLA